MPENAVWTSCPTCGLTQRIHEVPVDETPIKVVYLCGEGCGPILTMRFAAEVQGPAIHLRGLGRREPVRLFCRPVNGDRESIGFPPSIGT